MSNKTNNYQQHLMKTLKDPQIAVEYLNTALEEEVEDPTLFLRALKNVAEAWGFTHLSELTGLDRAGIYKMLSETGNPRLSSLHSLLDAMGLKLAIVQKSEAA
jgi:probable addiction module antidote protein